MNLLLCVYGRTVYGGTSDKGHSEQETLLYKGPYNIVEIYFPSERGQPLYNDQKCPLFRDSTVVAIHYYWTTSLQWTKLAVPMCL